MINFKNVSKKYNNSEIISNFNLEIRKGELVVLIGESGSGKTTLLKMINRLIPLSSGDIIVNDKSIKSWNPVNLRRKIGYVIQQQGKIWSNPSMIKAMDAAIENPITVGKNRTVLQAMEIIREKKIDGLLVVDKERTLLGCVALKDLRKLDKSSLTIEEVMNLEVPQVNIDTDIVEIVGRFENNPLGYLAVTDSCNKLKGLITKSTLLSLLGSQFIEMEVK